MTGNEVKALCADSSSWRCWKCRGEVRLEVSSDGELLTGSISCEKCGTLMTAGGLIAAAAICSMDSGSQN